MPSADLASYRPWVQRLDLDVLLYVARKHPAIGAFLAEKSLTTS
jgi:hypothetical protein